jgi:hypothetical protein
MRDLAMIFIAALAAVAAYIAIELAPEGGLPGAGAAPAASKEAFAAAILTKPHMGFLRIAQTRAPADFEAILAELMALDADGRREADFAAAAAVTADYVRRNLGDLRRAPQESLIAVIETHRAILAAVADDPQACNLVIMGGFRGTDIATVERIVPAVAAKAEALFIAIYDGRERGAPIDPPSEADWREVADGWMRQGGTREMLERIVTPDPADPALCGAFLSFMSYLVKAGSPSLRRVRAEFAVRAHE